MKKIVKLSVAAAMLMGMSAVSAQADDGINLLSNVTVKGEIRPRYEMVDTNANPAVGNANAVTNRFVLGVGADLADSDIFSGYVEMTDVHSLNDDNYNSGANENPNKKNLVVDPEQTRLTQAYIDVKLGKTLIRAGRQMINLDNQRFVGAVGWRQMPQTYNAVLVANSSVENLSLAASWATGVNTIFADDTTLPDGKTKNNSYGAKVGVLHAAYKASDALTATAYAYLISVEGGGHDTYGFALTGKPKMGNIVLNYRAEYATQTDASLEYKGTGKGLADASYYNLVLGMNMSGMLAGVGYEVLSGQGDATTGGDTTFQTPLATAHAFNGWADIFLNNGGNQGLKDLSLMVGYKSKDLGLFKVIYHDFQAEASVIGQVEELGTEVDAVYKRAVPGVKGLTGMLKFADYQADSKNTTSTGSTDTQKVWFMLDYKFASK